MNELIEILKNADAGTFVLYCIFGALIVAMVISMVKDEISHRNPR